MVLKAVVNTHFLLRRHGTIYKDFSATYPCWAYFATRIPFSGLTGKLNSFNPSQTGKLIRLSN